MSSFYAFDSVRQDCHVATLLAMTKRNWAVSMLCVVIAAQIAYNEE